MNLHDFSCFITFLKKNIHVLLCLKKYIFKIFQDFSRFLKSFIKDLEWCFITFYLKKIHVLSMIFMKFSRSFMFYQWFWWFFQDFSGFFKIFQDFLSFIKNLEWCFIAFYLKNIHVWSMIFMKFSRFFKIFHVLSMILMIFSRFFKIFHVLFKILNDILLHF